MHKRTEIPTTSANWSHESDHKAWIVCIENECIAIIRVRKHTARIGNHHYKCVTWLGYSFSNVKEVNHALTFTDHVLILIIVQSSAFHYDHAVLFHTENIEVFKWLSERQGPKPRHPHLGAKRSSLFRADSREHIDSGYFSSVNNILGVNFLVRSTQE